MSKKYTIGVDFGTLSGRAVLVDVSDGGEIASSVHEYAHGVIDSVLPGTGESLPELWALQDPADYIETLASIIPDVIKKSGVNKKDIIGIGVDFTACTVIPAKADGTPLSFLPEWAGNRHAWCKLWKHHAAQGFADRINETFSGKSDPWMDTVCGKMSSEAFLPKAWQIFAEAPEVYEAADMLIEACDWINLLLTGELTVGYVIAAYKSCYLPGRGYPSREFLSALDPRLCDLFEKKCPGRIVYPGEAAGRVTREAAMRFGLPEGIPVAAAVPDAHVGAFSVGLKETGDMFGIFGTSNCYFLMGDGRRIIPGICGTIEGGILPGKFGYEAGLCCFGDHFAWAAKNAPAEYENEAKERGIPVLRLLIEKASRLRPGESGLVALDWWNGNRSMLVDNSLSGVIVGMTLRTKPEDIMRALIEATAFGTRTIFDAFRDSGCKIRRFMTAGGVPLKDPFTMQLYADVLRIPIEVSSTRQAAALGDAIHASAVAGREAGGYGSVAEAIRAMAAKTAATYYPDPAASAVYDLLYEEYVRLHDWFGRGGNDVMKRLRSIHG